MPVLQHPRMSRLGLLAAAFSDGSVVLYALPHPGALQSSTRTQVKGRKSHAALIPLCPRDPGSPELQWGRSCAEGCLLVAGSCTPWLGSELRSGLALPNGPCNAPCNAPICRRPPEIDEPSVAAQPQLTAPIHPLASADGKRVALFSQPQSALRFRMGCSAAAAPRGPGWILPQPATLPRSSRARPCCGITSHPCASPPVPASIRCSAGPRRSRLCDPAVIAVPGMMHGSLRLTASAALQGVLTCLDSC